MTETMSDRIKAQRKSLCSSTKEFEKKYGISASNMSKWESDAHGIQVENLVKLATIFGCSTDYLIHGASQKTHEYSSYYDELGLEPVTVDYLKAMKRINNWPDFSRLLHHISSPALVEEIAAVQKEMGALLEKLKDFVDLDFKYANFLIIYPFAETELIYWEAEYQRQKSEISNTFRKPSSKSLFAQKMETFEQRISRSIDFLDEELHERDLDILASIYLTALRNEGEDRGLTLAETWMIMGLLQTAEKVYLERYNFNDAVRRRTQYFIEENKDYFSEYLALRGRYNDLRQKCDEIYEKNFNELEKGIQKASLADMLVMPNILSVIMDADNLFDRNKLLRATIMTSVNDAHVNKLVKDYIGMTSEEIERYKAFWEDCLDYYKNKVRSSLGGVAQYELLKDNALLELDKKGLKEIINYEK